MKEMDNIYVRNKEKSSKIKKRVKKDWRRFVVGWFDVFWGVIDRYNWGYV